MWGGVINIDFRPASNFMIGKFVYYLNMTVEESKNNFNTFSFINNRFSNNSA